MAYLTSYSASMTSSGPFLSGSAAPAPAAAPASPSGAGEDHHDLVERLVEESLRTYALKEGQIYDLVIHQVERGLIGQALKHCDGVKIRAANFLGINRNTLNKKVRDWGLEPEELTIPDPPKPTSPVP